MACSDTGDVNVFLSRVRFGGDHLPSQTPTSSLLTFADMVLALDNKVFNEDIMSNSTTIETNLQDDHTYASNKAHKMTTRSQAMRINNQQTLNEKRRHFEASPSDFRDEINGECLSNSDPGGIRSVTNESHMPLFGQDHGHSRSSCGILKSTATAAPNKHCHETEMERRVKRSSSVENITAESVTIDTFSEWPQTSRKNSPRKSCSFEEVSKNTGSQKSDEKRKGGSSGQLHRLVNDTVEFPCWPRKADHTYATATWDGTAASHSLFEQELNQDTRTDDLEMEVTESFALPIRKGNPISHFDESPRNIYNALQNHTYQKEDHTYVKQSNNIPAGNFSSFDSEYIKKTAYSCATFPRQKSREDHTYFSSGLTKHASSSSGGKDWNSIQTVSNVQQNKERMKLISKNVSPQFLSSAKKDHNYFTSAS